MNKKLNIDTTEIDVSSIDFDVSSHTTKTQRNLEISRFKSYPEMIDNIRSHIIKQRLKSIVLDSNQNLKTSYTITSTEISDALTSTCDIAVDAYKSLEDTVYIYRPDLKIMTSQVAFFEKVIADIASNVDFNQEEYQTRLIVDDISKMTNKVIKKLTRSSHIRHLVKIPNQYLVANNDVVIDLISKNVKKIDDIISKYDIISKSAIRYIPKSILSKEILDKVVLYEAIISRIFKDWSDGDKDVEYLLWQLPFSILQHDNHHRCVVLKGPGGNGKSAYMTLLSKLAGEDNTEYANIHQFGDPNTLNNITSATRLIIGDDAATNHKLSDVALSNLKSIVTGDPISLPVKYSSNVIIRSNSLFIQGTNTDISFYENNPALKSRMLVINWTDTDFRSNKPADVTFNLDELIEDQLFIDVFGMMCVEKVEFFNEFKIPQKVTDATDEMIESNDTIKQFLDEVYPTINGFEEIPISVMYQAYCKWMKINNPRGGLLKNQTFTKSLSKYEKTYQFTLSDNSRKKRFKNDKHTSCIVNILDISIEDVNLNNPQSYLISENKIKHEEISSIDFDKLHSNDIDERIRQILYIKAYVLNDTSVLSKFSDEF